MDSGKNHKPFKPFKVTVGSLQAIAHVWTGLWLPLFQSLLNKFEEEKILFYIFPAMSKINHEKQPVIVFLRCNWHNLCPNRNLWWSCILPCCAICRVYLCPHNNTLGTFNRECSRKEVRVIWYLNLDPVLISKFAWIYIMLFIFPCTANRLSMQPKKVWVEKTSLHKQLSSNWFFTGTVW